MYKSEAILLRQHPEWRELLEKGMELQLSQNVYDVEEKEMTQENGHDDDEISSRERLQEKQRISQDENNVPSNNWKKNHLELNQNHGFTRMSLILLQHLMVFIFDMFRKLSNGSHDRENPF